MRYVRFLQFTLIAIALSVVPALAQSEHLAVNETATATSLSKTQVASRPKLSPGAQEMAKLLGVMPLIDRLYSLSDRDRGAGGGVMSAEALSLRQELTEAALSASLDVDGVKAEIDNEIARTREARDYLESRRDRALGINNIANLVSGGALSIVSSVLQLPNFTDSVQDKGNVIGIIGGGISAVLSTIALRQQRGQRRALRMSPNMLAKFFDRPGEFNSDYPEDLWTYLNSAPPAETGGKTRRAILIEQWIEQGRIDQTDTPKGRRKIDLLTSGALGQKGLTIDQLTDRQSMLSDVRAQIGQMMRDLSKLMLAIKTPLNGVVSK